MFLQQITYLGGSVLQTNAQLCVGGCGNHEDVGHLLLRCDFFGRIWSLVSHWIGFETMNSVRLTHRSIQFGHLGGCLKNSQ